MTGRASGVALMGLAVLILGSLAWFLRASGRDGAAEAPAQGSSSLPASGGSTLSPPTAGRSADRAPLAEPTENAERDREAWVRDGRDIVVRGRPMLDVMRDWHGADWPLVEEAILATLNHEDSYNLDLPLERDSLGDIDACFEVAPEQALKWFEGSAMPRMVRSFAGTTSSVDLPGPVILRAAVKNPLFNPAGLSFDREHQSWAMLESWIDQERQTFSLLAEALLDAQRSTIRASLQQTDRFTRPPFGELYIAPFLVPHAPGVSPSAAQYQPPVGTILLMNDSLGDCAMFGMIYYLDFRTVPEVASRLADWESYDVILKEEFRRRVAELPTL
jgi:hypothetical protein